MHTQRMSAARIIRSPAEATAFLIPQSTTDLKRGDERIFGVHGDVV
jgi:hypothetical protein